MDVIRDVLFWALSALAVWSGWRVFRVDPMIRATFSLLVSFLCVGGIGLLLSAPYIGVATVFMMAVGMMVMGLFMVAFMMNPAGLDPMSMVHQHRLSIAAGVLAFVALAGAAIWTDLPSDPVPADARVVHDLGIELLGDSMLVFETAGVTLLATMLCAVILSRRRGRFSDAMDGAVPPSLEPGGAPAGRVPGDSGGHHMHHGHGGHGHEGHGGQDHAGDGPGGGHGHAGHHAHVGHGGDPHGGGHDDGGARGDHGQASSDPGNGDDGNGRGHGADRTHKGQGGRSGKGGTDHGRHAGERA